jgi:hypothetical protein
MWWAWSICPRMRSTSRTRRSSLEYPLAEGVASWEELWVGWASPGPPQYWILGGLWATTLERCLGRENSESDSNGRIRQHESDTTAQRLDFQNQRPRLCWGTGNGTCRYTCSDFSTCLHWWSFPCWGVGGWVRGLLTVLGPASLVLDSVFLVPDSGSRFGCHPWVFELVFWNQPQGGTAISLFLLHYLGWNLEGLFCVIPYWVLEHLLRFGADWEGIGTIS